MGHHIPNKNRKITNSIKYEYIFLNPMVYVKQAILLRHCNTVPDRTYQRKFHVKLNSTEEVFYFKIGENP